MEAERQEVAQWYPLLSCGPQSRPELRLVALGFAESRQVVPRMRERLVQSYRQPQLVVALGSSTNE